MNVTTQTKRSTGEPLITKHNRFREHQQAGAGSGEDQGQTCTREERGACKEASQQAERRTRQQKAEVIAMMKRTRGATLGEIMADTKGQPHTVRALSVSWQQGKA